jgi:hypothetical protein
MNRPLVDRIVDAVLYEGYILYPYRPSVKNRQRWTFGGLYPEAYCQAQRGADAPSNQTECLVHGGPHTTLDVAVRFLHLTERTPGELLSPLAEWPDVAEPPHRPVETLQVGDQVFHVWQEAEERRIELAGVAVSEILNLPCLEEFSLRGRRWTEPLRGPGGEIVGVLAREQRAVEGAMQLVATDADDGLFKLTVRVINRTPLEDDHRTDRDAALLRTLVSTHAVLKVRGGAFVSLLDPPEAWREAAATCRNVGTWPVLVGKEGDTDTLLSSPIILYDYPQLAPESPGDLFDATEIDEILTLRILTLTDEEKQAAGGLDGRTRELLARTEALAREQLSALHGTLRSPRQNSGGRA